MGLKTLGSKDARNKKYKIQNSKAHTFNIPILIGIFYLFIYFY